MRKRSISGVAHTDPVCSFWQFRKMGFGSVKQTVILQPSPFLEAFSFGCNSPSFLKLALGHEHLNSFWCKTWHVFFNIRDKCTSLWRQRKLQALSEADCIQVINPSLRMRGITERQLACDNFLHSHVRQCTELSTRN